jgi:hypothetical protein
MALSAQLRTFVAKTAASVIVAEGLEYAARPNRFHYAARKNRMHYAARPNRFHYEAKEDDR